MKKAPKREALSRDRILAAALAVVDQEGLEAISMRRLGEELGVEAMSLYNHVANKAAILDGIFEAVLAEIPPTKRTEHWPHDVRHRARALRRVLLSHPNVLPLFAARPAVTPASITHVEAALDVLRRAGFTATHALNALQVTVAFVVGHTIAAHGSGRSDAPVVDYERLSETEFPRVREMARQLERHDVEAEFEFGIDLLIAGLKARLAPAP